MALTFSQPRVLLIATSRGTDIGPEDLVAFGARATLSKHDAYTLFKETLAKGELTLARRKTLDVAISSGHLSVLEHAVFTYVLKDIPRTASLMLVQPLYLSHLQQSQRYTRAGSVYLPEDLKSVKEVVGLLAKAFKLYEALIGAGVSVEDARYALPLYTSTNMQTTGNARELTHLYLLSKEEGVPRVNKLIVEEMIKQASEIAPEIFKDRGLNYANLMYYPSSNIFSLRNEPMRRILDEFEDRSVEVKMLHFNEPFRVDENELKDALKRDDERYFSLLRYNTYTFLAKMSLVAFHQAVRQRLWLHNVESIYSSLQRRAFVIPPEVTLKGFRDAFIELVDKCYSIIHEHAESFELTDLIGLVPQAHAIYDMIRVDGWSVLSTIPLRRCLRAQWEIRKIANDMSKLISKVSPSVGKYCAPRCIVFGECNERRPCSYRDALVLRKLL